MKCSQCGEQVEYALNIGWIHLNSEITHSVSVGALTEEAKEKMPTFVDSLVEGALDSLDFKGVALTVNQFLRNYHHVPGVEWQKVRRHDQGKACHCSRCSPVCVVCLAKKAKPFTYVPVEERVYE